MKQLIKLYILIFVSSFSINSQAKDRYPNGPQVVVKDTAKWEMVYVHRMVDSKSERAKTNYEILTIGKNFSHYGNYGLFQYDSIIRVNNQWINSLTNEEDMALSRSFKKEFDHVLLNLKNSNLEYFGNVFMDYYHYTEPLPKMEWTLHDETIEVLGHKCHKATTTWRGRNWIAWYSDIPLCLGPWKFNGLPGLILRLEDDQWEHYFEATKSMNWVYPFGHKKRSILSKTTREKYNAELKDFMQNPGKTILDSGMVTLTDEQRKKRLKGTSLFHLPIELE